MLRKVISGGQTGVDQAALRAAKTWELETGGSMPLRFMTETGPAPHLAAEFGMTETTVASPHFRTAKNVADSDATLWIGNRNSPGGRCTFRAVRDHGKMAAAVDEGELVSLHLRHRALKRVAAFVLDCGYEVLNVAGNRETSNPGIGERAERFLNDLFAMIRAA